MKRCKGSITIFLTLILMVMFMLICGILESARVTSAAARAKSITYMSLDSCFALYAREIFEDYGIMMLYSDKEELTKSILEVGNRNCYRAKHDGKYCADIYHMKVDKTDIINIKHISDRDGEVFAGQICDYMKMKIPEDALNALVSKNENIKQGEETGKEFKSINECNKQMEKLEQELIRMKEYCVYYSDVTGEPAVLINNMIVNGTASYGSYVSWHDEVDEYLQKIISYGDEVAKISSTALIKVNKSIKELEADKSKYSKDVYDSMMDELVHIRDSVDITATDKYKVVECCDKASEYAVILNNINNGVLKYKTSEFKETKYLDEVLDDCKLFKKEGVDVSIQYSDEKDEVQDNMYESGVQSFVEKGILSAVIKDTSALSGKSLLSKEALPSANEYNKSAKWKDWSGVRLTANRTLLSEYVLQHFGNYINSKEGEIDYEAEYVIAGGDSDRENLKNVAERIVAIRSGFNFVSLLKDNEKRNEAYGAAVSIAGATGIPAIVRIVQFGIMFAWSSGEAVVDTRNIMGGKKVALIKSKNEWNLSLASLISMKIVDRDSDDENGIGYEDYLRTMLYGTNKVDVSYRIMDLIQLNVRKKYNSEFLINKCIVSADVRCTFGIGRVFGGVIPGYSIGDGGKYALKVRGAFEY